MTPYRLLFLDIDGTLVGETGPVPPRTQEALRRARERGCIPVLCTGRSRLSAWKVAAQIGGHGYGIVMNGALVLDWETGRALHRAFLSLPTAQEAARIAVQSSLAPVALDMEAYGDLLYTDRRPPLMPRYAACNADRLVFCDDLAVEMPAPPASMAAYGTPEQTTTLAAAWLRMTGPPVRAYAAPTAGYGCWYAQLNAFEADKALAAQIVARTLGIPREQTLAVGDHVNDLDLLRWAGLGICMGDGHPDARACADHVTGSCAEDGVAAAVERFLLSS